MLKCTPIEGLEPRTYACCSRRLLDNGILDETEIYEAKDMFLPKKSGLDSAQS